jgi:hypothetical protein
MMMKRKKRKKSARERYDEQVKNVGASLQIALEKVGRPAVFLFCGVRSGHGATTLATSVSRVLGESGARTILATAGVSPDGERDRPSRGLGELLQAGGAVDFDDSCWARVAVPGHFLEIPEPARDPRTWVKAYDLMILDSPPLADVATRYWIPRTHGVVLVVDGERAGVGAVIEARDTVTHLGGTFVGVVLNRYLSRVPSALR